MAGTYKIQFWEDVTEGQSIPSVSMPITLSKMVVAAAGVRDFQYVHHDVEKTRDTGNRTIFLNTTFQQAFLNRVINDWMGPGGDLRRLRINMKSPIYLGTTMTGSGEVLKKYRQDGKNLVELKLTLSTEDGLCTEGSATISLPSRDSA